MKTTKLVIAIPLVFHLLCFAQSGSAPNPLSRFAGVWTANPAKSSQPGLGSGLTFQSGPGGALQEQRGSSLAPLIEEIRFDGKPHEIDSGKATMAWKQTAPGEFEEQLFDHGQTLISTRRIRISNAGKTLTEESERHRPDGTTNVITVVYGRGSGEGVGLAGTWNVQSRSGVDPPQFTVSTVGDNQFTLLRRSGATFTAALDNKPVPVTGPGVILGTTMAVKRIDDRTIATTAGRNGIVTGNGTMTLSPDGKVLTFASQGVGPNATASVEVYEKQ
jgi:hypothetical protein